MLKPPTHHDTRPSALYLDEAASIRPMSPPRAARAVLAGRTTTVVVAVAVGSAAPVVSRSATRPVAGVHR